MKVIVDTNVLVSAVLKDRVPEEIILFITSRDDIEWIVSSQIMEEYKEVLGRDKFGLPGDILQEWFVMLDALTSTVDVDLDIDFPPDQKDAKFLACAIAANADYFVTGDRDFSEAQRLAKTTILSVSQFNKLVCDAMGKH